MRGEDRIKIEFVRSGGFGGLLVHAEVDTADLPAREASEIRRLLDDVDLSDLTPTPAGTSTMPDLYQYDITIMRGDERGHFRFDDLSAPASLRPLLDHLSRLARPR